MSKDRNTIAKRQRENEKKRKAEEKREKRKQRKEFPVVGETGQAADGSDNDRPEFSKEELRVFDAFRKYLMTPGQMLCFNAQDIESMRDALEDLIDQGMLISEGSKGAYSLTREGFDAMKAIAD